MDDTIENLLDAWVKWLNSKYNLSVSLDDCKTWRLEEIFPLTTEQIFEPLSENDFWKTVSPKEDAILYLRKLIEEDHQQVYICTASHPDTIKCKYQYLIQRYFPFISWRNIIVCKDKQMVKCDIMIDDGPHNLENGDYLKILLDAPHNRSYDVSEHNMKRCFNWEEIYNTILDIDWLKN